MPKSSRPALAFLLILSILANGLPPLAAAAAVRQAGPRNPIAELDLFNPSGAAEALPDLQSFDQWSRTDEGKALSAPLLESEEGRWIGLFQGIDATNPDRNRLALISPVLQQIDRTPSLKSRFQDNIRQLASGSLSSDQQSKLFQQIVRDLHDARDAVADRAVAQLRRFQVGYAARIKTQALQRTDVVREVDLMERTMIDPISYLYGTSKANSDVIADLSRYLTGYNSSFLGEGLTKGIAEAEEFEDFNQSPKVTFIQPARLPPSADEDQDSDVLITPQVIPPRRSKLWVPGKPTIIKPGSRLGEIRKIILGNRDTGIKVDPVVFPNLPGNLGATDVPALLEAGNLASDITYISMYEQGLDQDVDSIIAQAKKGKKFVIVADYSQLFPEKVARDNGRPVKPRRPQYQKLVDAFLAQNPTSNNWNRLNIQLYALKGKGSIGINHNKFRIWTFPDGRKVLQVGSFNYTPRSQNTHWENVLFFDSSTPEGAKIVDIFERYHHWQISGGGAVPFSEDLDREDPDITTPIWKQKTFEQKYGDKDFANVSFSPDGGTLDWLSDLIDMSNQEVYFVIFGFYPPKELMDTLKTFMKRAKKRPNQDAPALRVLADYSQAHNSASMAALKLIMEWQDAEVRLISGPHEPDPWQHHELGEFNHNKLVRGTRIDPKKVMQSVVGSGSTNVSRNAWFSSFENMVWMVLDRYQKKYETYSTMLGEYMDALWDLGFEPKFDRRRRTNEFDPSRPLDSTGEQQ